MTEAEKLIALAREEYDCCYLQNAVRLLRKAIKLGSSDAMVELGNLYRHGDGVPKSAKRAFNLYLQAANLGNARGMNMVGVLYSNGEGVKASDEKSYEWCRKAAEAGNAAGMYNLAYNYLEGEIVEQDTAVGIEWLMRAAEGGYPDAMYDAAGIYSERGDDKKAFEFMLKATQTGHVRASNELGVMYYEGIGVEKDIRMALNCFEGAALYDDIDAILNLARYYTYVEKNTALAAKFYNEAVALGDDDALNELGDLYFANKDYESAVKVFQTAVDKGSTYAMRALSFMYAESVGVEENLTLAFDLIERAAVAGDLKAMADLGQIYACDPDEFRYAHYWLKKSADGGNTDAIMVLAEFLENHGQYKHARYWYNKALEAGIEGASEGLEAVKDKIKPPQKF
ncbi:MAG: sel1 repeat family protein [Selenomonadaceae bacterium]|nr:sel1 repeat family protein [Selenomonadaceae bacterium]